MPMLIICSIVFWLMALLTLLSSLPSLHKDNHHPDFLSVFLLILSLLLLYKMVYY